MLRQARPTAASSTASRRRRKSASRCRRPTASASWRAPGGSNTFEGLNHFDQRYADSAQQFSTEPPDQGLCVGNGFVLEAVNDVAQVYDAATGAGQGVASLNQFFGYPSAIVRYTDPSNDVFGPFVTDPSCHYDAASDRWFLTVLTLDVVPSGVHAGDFTGQNTIDLAVSNTGDPRGAWTYYHLDVTSDGASNFNLGDYPHFARRCQRRLHHHGQLPVLRPRLQRRMGLRAQQGQAGERGDRSASSPCRWSTSAACPATRWPRPSRSATQTATANGTEYFMSATTVFESSANEIDVWALDGTNSAQHRQPGAHAEQRACARGRLRRPAARSPAEGRRRAARGPPQQQAGCRRLRPEGPAPPAGGRHRHQRQRHEADGVR